MKGKYSTSITMSEADHAAFLETGMKVIEVFRLGLSAYGDSVTIRRLEPAKMKKVISTPKDVERYVEVAGEYGCGCRKVDGKQLCPKHSRY